MMDKLEHRLQSALAELERRWPGRFSLRGALGQGTANHLWHLYSAEGNVVLRLHGTNAGVDVDRAKEAEAWRRASAIGRAPELLHFEPAFSLARWGGEHPGRLDIPPLVDLLVALHQLPRSAPRLDPLAEIRQYQTLSGRSFPDDTREALVLCWQALQSTSLEPGFCHMDLHAGNLVVDEQGRWRALDFEYVRTAMPQFDLAPAMMSLTFNQGQRLWRDYLQQRGIAPTAGEWRCQVAANCLASGLGWCWALAQKDKQVAQQLGQEFDARLREWLDKFVVC